MFIASVDGLKLYWMQNDDYFVHLGSSLKSKGRIKHSIPLGGPSLYLKNAHFKSFFLVFLILTTFLLPLDIVCHLKLKHNFEVFA